MEPFFYQKSQKGIVYDAFYLFVHEIYCNFNRKYHL